MARDGGRFVPQGLALLTVLVLLATLSGCGDRGLVKTGSTTSAPGSQSGGLSTILATPVSGEGLAALTSYTLGVESQTEVTRPTARLESSSVIEKQVRAQPAPGAYSLTITDKSSSKPEQVRLIVAGSDGYVYSTEQQKWLKLSVVGNEGVDPNAARLLDPGALVASVPSGLLGPGTLVSAHERIEGLDTAHYRLTGQDLARWAADQSPAGSEILSGQADFWIVNQASYLKQYQFQTTVREPGGTEKRHTARLLVRDENKPVTVATPLPDQVIAMPVAEAAPTPLPAGAAGPAQATATAALRDLPAPPQGQPAALGDLSRELQGTVDSYGSGMAAQSIYVSTATAEDIAAYYQRELPARGWTLAMISPAKGPTLPTLAMYNKGKQQLMLVILPAEDGRRVALLQIPE